ncbi:L-rhamnose mutarotase [Bacteroides cellulosilyticus]|jgi:L-rhamnose mutarotase|uniref:L-rhamnose mutarotase n=1 Tax=Bacteroides cellulosilyticus TaxID=246787 RepID=A0A412IBJ3_9BACE|nr:L-rhamnose mutarotase [Bacteroides cellulosilyticus]RGS34221.1 L-rhamnose mutarotase [Bacteroides cellulosilyticus]
MTYNQGYTAKQHSVPVKRYCQTLNLKNNPALIAEYRKIHSKKEAWPEIRKGIRSVGILEMEIYISGFQVFMIIETPLDFDWETAMNTLSHLPKQAEREEYVSEFQECAPKSTSAEKWKLMERMFYLYD